MTPRLRLDLHLHTRGSFDCLSDPEEILARATEQGIGRIAITDHDRIHVALEMAARHPDRVIAGEEVKTAEGVDVIGLYLRQEIPGGTPAEETCDRIRAQGGLVYLPHPYASGKGGSGKLAERLAPRLHVVEAFNGRLRDPERERKAVDLAERHGLLMGAGTDAHTVGEIGLSWIEVPHHPNTPEALLAALREGTIQGRKSRPGVHLASTWAKLRKRLPGA